MHFMFFFLFYSCSLSLFMLVVAFNINKNGMLNSCFTILVADKINCFVSISLIEMLIYFPFFFSYLIFSILKCFKLTKFTKFRINRKRTKYKTKNPIKLNKSLDNRYYYIISITQPTHP